MLKTLLSGIITLVLGLFILMGQQAYSLGSAAVPVTTTVSYAAHAHDTDGSSKHIFHGVVGVAPVMRDAPRDWQPVYERAQCMVQIKINRRGEPVTAAQWFKIEYRAMPYLFLEAPKFGLAAFNYRSQLRSLYWIYAKNCNKRFELTEMLFTRMKNAIVGFPEFKVLHQTVSPSFETLNICGHWWKDGMMGDCYKQLSPPNLAQRDGRSNGVYH